MKELEELEKEWLNDLDKITNPTKFEAIVILAIVIMLAISVLFSPAIKKSSAMKKNTAVEEIIE